MPDYVLLLWEEGHYRYHHETSGIRPSIAGIKQFCMDGHWVPVCRGPATGRTYYRLSGDAYHPKQMEFVITMFELFVPTNIGCTKYDTNYSHPYIIEEV